MRNSGAAFSMGTSYTWVLTLVATGVVIGIIWMGRDWCRRGGRSGSA